MVPEKAASPAPSMGNSVIPLMNKLQDIFARLDGQPPIELPQVAVVGSQSSGKSSVLESLVGRDFLPKGSDICTRRPIVLQLIQTKRNPNAADEEWGQFLHLPGFRFYDFSEIRREIQAETERGAGANKGVSDKKITLKIFSPNVLDITLVDLPGITKVPVGDQPSDIEDQIRKMILSYIDNPSCLILAVTPANSDLANSDAIQIARSADPNGDRTIGVITKLDIMDRGTNARNFLLGKVIPLRLGYVGVVNRSQEDILMNRSIKDALAAEEEFFHRRPIYSDLADCCGASQLGKKLNKILAQHIKTRLPELKSCIGAALASVAKEQTSYGYIAEKKGDMKKQLLNILSKYSKAFLSMIEGRNDEMLTSEIYGGARIHCIFQNIFVKSLEEIDPFKDLTDENIHTAIQNAAGPQSSLYVLELPFQILVQRQIAHLRDPSLQCAWFIYDELIKMSHQCLVSELQLFPVLRMHMDEILRSFLREEFQPLKSRIEDMIEMEMDCINTSHPQFIGGSRAMEMAYQQVISSRMAISAPVQKGVQSTEEIENSRLSVSGARTRSSWGIASIFVGSNPRVSVKQNPISNSFTVPAQSVEEPFSVIHLNKPPNVLIPSETLSDHEAIKVAAMKLLLRSYYDIVRGIIEDFVPKAIMHFLVNHTKRELHNLFLSNLYREDLIEELMQESDEIAMKRKRTRDRYCALEQAFQTLDALSFETELVEKGYSSSNHLSAALSSSSSGDSSSVHSAHAPSFHNPWSC